MKYINNLLSDVKLLSFFFRFLGFLIVIACLIIDGDKMKSIYDDPFMEILDRIMQSGLDYDDVCMLLACFLQERKEMESCVYSLPN